jgi:hypothetical protein
MNAKIRTDKQNKSIHKGLTDISTLLIENGISLNAVIKNLQIRPTPEALKEVFKAIAKAKYGVESTTQLQTNQIEPIWEELIKAVSETTGIYIEFPSEQSKQEYINSLDK